MSSIYYIGNNNYTKYHPSNINECLEWCLSQYILVLDIETQRKYPKGTYDESFYFAGLDTRLSKICMFQIGNLDRQYIIDARCIDLTLLMPILESNSILKIIHNAQFECKHILHNYGIRIQNIWDTMIVEKLLYNGYPQSYSLAAIAEKRLGIKSNDTSLFDIFDEEIEEYEYEFEEFGFDFPKKETVDKSVRMQFVEWGDKPFTEEQIEYGAGDLTIPYRIFAKQREHEKTDYYPKYGIELENKTTFVLAEMSYHGIPINTEKWLQTESNNKEKYSRQRQAIDEYIIDNEPQFSFDVDIFTNKRTCSIDWGSPQKVINLFKHWKICPKEKSKQTGKLEYSVGAKALFKKLPNSHKEMFMKDKFPESINDKDDFTLSYLLYKKTEQLIQAFGSSWLSCVHPITGRIHTNYNQIMISTRLSSSSPNCYHKDTEVLTSEFEWVKISELKGNEKIAQYIKETNAIEFVNYTNYIKKYSKNLLNIYTDYFLDLAVTHDHRCLFQNRKTGVFMEKKAEEFINDYKVIHSGIYKNNSVLSEDFCKLVVAIQADGSITTNKGLDFGFTKERKKDRLISILNNLNIPYVLKNGSNNRFRFKVEAEYATPFLEYLNEDKTFSTKLLKDGNLVAIADELFYWDGDYTRRGNYVTSSMKNIKVLQALHALIGRRTGVYAKHVNNKLYYTLNITDKNNSSSTNFQSKELEYNDYTYCVSVPSTWLLTKYNNKVVVSGNCQQIPRSKDFRGCIESDGLLVCADYTAQEVYSAAYVHKSKPLLKFFKEGDPVYGTDIHSFMAAKTFKLVYKDDDFFCDAKSPERQQQKIISFQSIYGGSEFTLSDSLGISAEEAKGIQDGFIKGFELEDSFTHYKKHAMDYGWVELDIKTGKRWFFSEYKKMLDAKEDALSYYPDNFNRFTKEDKEKWKAEQKIENPIISELWRTHMILKGKLERKSLNLRVQGLCASMTKKALVDISEFLWKKNLNNNFKMIISCHDECVGDLNKNHLEDKEKYGKVVQHYMEKASAFFLDGLVSKADPIYSKYWAK